MSSSSRPPESAAVPADSTPRAAAGAAGPPRCCRSALDPSPCPDPRSGEIMTGMRSSVLFVCVHNAGRSQMAAGFLRELAGEAVEVLSAGSAPGVAVNPVAVAAMAERGIDIAAAVPRRLADTDVEVADVVVTMGCGDTCPYIPGRRYED